MLGGKRVKVDLQLRQIIKLWEPCQELSYLEGSHPHIPGVQIRGMCGAAKEMGHHVISGAAIGAGRVIGPVCGLSSGYCPKSATADSVPATASIIFPDYRVYQIRQQGFLEAGCNGNGSATSVLHFVLRCLQSVLLCCPKLGLAQKSNHFHPFCGRT